MPSVRGLAAACSLLLTLWMPEAAWAGAHLLFEHHHDQPAALSEPQAHTRCARLAVVLEHGHSHSEGTPGHEHRVRQAPPLSPRVAPGPSARPHPLALTLAEIAGSAFGSAIRPTSDPFACAGTGPPARHLLCTLLI